MILQTQGESISSEQLSMLLKGAGVVSVLDSGLGAKLVAGVHKPAKPVSSEKG